MKRMLALIVGLFSFLIANGQVSPDKKGSISGIVLDSSSKEPISFAVVALYTRGNAQPVSIANTDEKGAFAFSGLAYRTYKVQVNLLGYQRFSRDSIVLNARQSTISLGKILLRSKDIQLKEVTIVGQRPTVEYKDDKIVYNVDQDLTSQGGAATDVLKKIPSVSVDVDGNVELQGDANVRFLINGKTSTMFGNSLADALRSIPASQIKSIEVITNPGAKYDAEGTGGIINIVLKDNKLDGINASVNLSAGTRFENGSFNFSIRKSNVAMSVFFSGNSQLNTTTHTTTTRVSADTGGTTNRLVQVGSSALKRISYQAGLNLEWDITPRNTLNYNIGINYFNNYNTGPVNQQNSILGSNGTMLYNDVNVLNTTNHMIFRTVDMSLNYKKTFARKDQELSVLCLVSRGNNSIYYSQTQTEMNAYTPFTGANSQNPGTDGVANLQIDYTHPFTDKISLETGAKTTLERITSAANPFILDAFSGTYLRDDAQSYNLDFNRNIYAAYLSGSFSLFKYLDVKAGARYEYTHNMISVSGLSSQNVPDYSTFIPSLNLAHTFSNDQNLKIAFSRRLERPDYRDMNPFFNSADPHNISTGNPMLLPEIGDKVEASYHKSFKKGISFSSTVFYQHNSQDIKQYQAYYPFYKIGDSIYTNVNVSTYANISAENRGGFTGYVTVPVTGKLKIQSNVQVYERAVRDDIITNTSRHGIEYRLSANASLQLPRQLAFEAFGNYSSPRVALQGQYPAFFSYNFACRKKLFKDNKGSIALVTTNPFGKYVTQRTHLDDRSFTLTSVRELPFRSFGINFTYTFGKLDSNKKKDMDNNSNQPAPYEY